ncbi:hypothetical protein HK105_205942 [Polyrhizophydium stewartii]|uniref:RRM domain-containing protein n=1 Tax=Polyrhizophydium stewartii TaxID=2732419 RepID=A0ABR4N4V7_9FUNG
MPPTATSSLSMPPGLGDLAPCAGLGAAASRQPSLAVAPPTASDQAKPPAAIAAPGAAHAETEPLQAFWTPLHGAATTLAPSVLTVASASQSLSTTQIHASFLAQPQVQSTPTRAAPHAIPASPLRTVSALFSEQDRPSATLPEQAAPRHVTRNILLIGFGHGVPLLELFQKLQVNGDIRHVLRPDSLENTTVVMYKSLANAARFFQVVSSSGILGPEHVQFVSSGQLAQILSPTRNPEAWPMLINQGRVRVSGMSSAWRDLATLRPFFDAFGAVLSIGEIPHSPGSLFSCVVEFDSTDEAAAAVRNLGCSSLHGPDVRASFHVTAEEDLLLAKWRTSAAHSLGQQPLAGPRTPGFQPPSQVFADRADLGGSPESVVSGSVSDLLMPPASAPTQRWPPIRQANYETPEATSAERHGVSRTLALAGITPAQSPNSSMSSPSRFESPPTSMSAFAQSDPLSSVIDGFADYSLAEASSQRYPTLGKHTHSLQPHPLHGQATFRPQHQPPPQHLHSAYRASELSMHQSAADLDSINHLGFQQAAALAQGAYGTGSFNAARPGGGTFPGPGSSDAHGNATAQAGMTGFGQAHGHGMGRVYARGQVPASDRSGSFAGASSGTPVGVASADSICGDQTKRGVSGLDTAELIVLAKQISHRIPPECITGVSIEDIASGRERRRTVMIRNIPNKFTQQMFIDLLNETHKGCYDFLYLRIDFKNKCNVGYAFVNFTSAEAVVRFADRFVGRVWGRFKSEKICGMGFATIQGRQALIEKFRNSSVMLENDEYKPKIFYTDGPHRGMEEPFPGPTTAGFRPKVDVLFSRGGAWKQNSRAAASAAASTLAPTSTSSTPY